MVGDHPLSARDFIKIYKVRLIAGSLLAGAAFLFWNSLPALLFNDPYCAVLYDGEEQLLGATIAGDEQWRFPPQSRIPDRYLRVLLEFEDRRFFGHRGVDPLALGRAFVANLRKRRIVSGGSTLTMQVIRLARDNPPRTLVEKLKEMILAVRLELSRSKSEILSLYTAHAPFGGNIVGLDAAAWLYFGRRPERLSWAETAFLAVLPNNPGLIRSAGGLESLRIKRNRLLSALLKRKIISNLEHTLALAEPIPRGRRVPPRWAPHLLDTLIGLYPKRRQFSTAIEIDLQRMLARIGRSQGEKLYAQDIKNLAALIIDNRKAAVVGYLGNVEVEPGRDTGQANDLIRSPRSTGSILKPFLYAAMLQSGDLTPETLVPDTPVHYAGFSPENFDRKFRGALPAREALAQSLNVSAVSMLRQFGVGRFCASLKKWGMTTLVRPPDDYGLTLILGGAEGTLFDITCLYAKLAQLARSGRRDTPEVAFLKDAPPRSTAMADLGTGAAFLTLEALVEVARPGDESFWRSFSSSKWIAWKTGTSYGRRDAWAVGVTPGYTVGVWAGNADGEGKPDLSGLATAAPVLFDIFNQLETGGNFERPLLSLKVIEVCRHSGCLPTDNCPRTRVWVPFESRFSAICTCCQLVHLDPSGRFQVDSRCERVDRMIHSPWFILPPIQEFYYTQYHPEYHKLPPYRRDCPGYLDAIASRRVMSLIYPERGMEIYLPVDLDGRLGQVVFQAVHREPEATIYWHLDDRFIAATRHFHRIALQPEPGFHRLILVDKEGRRIERSFRVLGRS